MVRGSVPSAAHLLRVWGLRAVLPAAMAVSLAACNATAAVTVRSRPDGKGAVTVTVTLDREAAAAVGNVAGQLQTSDLSAAGWQVSAPSQGAGGSVVVSATHQFSSLGEVPGIVSELAGSGASRPFRLSISRSSGLLTTTTRLSGAADLSCGFACFGDQGLARLLGSPTGVDPALAGRLAGVDPASVFHFVIQARLPGRITTTNAASRPDGELTWTPELGQDLALSASTRTVNTTAVAALAAGGGALLVVLAGGLSYWAYRRRRRHRAAASPAAGG